MKKLLVIMFVVILTGCSSMPHSYRTVNAKLYTITSSYYEDIRGNFKHDTLLLYKDYAALSVFMEYFGIGTFNNENSSDTQNYYAEVFCIFPNWRFIDTILIKTDSNLYTLKDNSPSRTVRSDANVEEYLSVVLSSEIITDIKATETLTIQYSAKPITISAEGIVALKEFINK